MDWLTRLESPANVLAVLTAMITPAVLFAIAVLNSIARNYLWVSVAFGMIGSSVMLYGSVLLIIESRMALAAVTSEIEFLSKVTRNYAH